MADRFRGFLPVVVDLETGGFNSKTDALLEIAAVFVDYGDGGILTRGETFRYHVKPFEGANMDPASLAVSLACSVHTPLIRSNTYAELTPLNLSCPTSAVSPSSM